MRTEGRGEAVTLKECELERVVQLFSDTLHLIANHPNYRNDRAAGWMKAKAQEALDKRDAAARGDIYAQIGDDHA